MKNSSVLTSVIAVFIVVAVSAGFILRGHALREADEAYPIEPAIIPPADATTASEDSIKPAPTPQPMPTPTQPASTALIDTVLASVPFISQAPRAQWNNQDFQDGCEEASILMAMNWANGATLNTRDATDDIQRLINFERDSAEGYRYDISAHDTAKLIEDYYHYTKVEVKEHITINSMIDALRSGSIMITPVNGQLLDNPNFTAPGPAYHMLVVIGYDPVRKQFITNDPGTRRGAHFRYNTDSFFAALRDYPSGHHEPITEVVKRVVVVSR